MPNQLHDKFKLWFASNRMLVGYVMICVIVLSGFILIVYGEWQESNRALESRIMSQVRAKEESDGIVNPMKVDGAESLIIVDLAGAVRRPGVYRVPAGSVVADVVAQAGGLSEEADRVRIAREMNQASPLSNYAKIYMFAMYDRDVPVVDGAAGNNEAVGTKAAVSGGEGKININEATIDDLDTLSGIGPATAEKIIDWREENGGFQSIEDLRRVKGIGEALFEKIKNNVIVR